MRIKKRFWEILFFLILLISGLIRFLQVKDFNTAFTFDQSRDMLDIRTLGEFKDLMVMGPTTSINGLRLGPFYYYLNLPAYWLGRGDPQILVYWNIVLFLFAGFFIFWFFKNKNIVLGFLISTIFLMAPQLFNTTRYFWNANTAIYLSVFYFLSLYNFSLNKDKKSILWMGLAAGFLTQFEAAFGIVCIAFSILIVALDKKFDRFKNLFLGIGIWFLPQILMEVKNKFQMTKLLLGTFGGTNSVLGESLGLGQVIQLHWKVIKQFFEGQFILPLGWGMFLLILAVILILTKKEYKRTGKYFLGFLFFAFIFYVAIYHHELKVWYLESLRVWYCFVIGTAMAIFVKSKNILGKILLVMLIIGFWSVSKDQWKFTKNKITDDPKNLANLINNIDWVYQKMNNEGFKAYTYVPEVYDYPSQYLYWWYGNKKYGYVPEKISYSLNEVPEYVKMSDKFFDGAKLSNGKIVLIYETKNSYIGWLGQFDKYCIVEKRETNWQTVVEIREKCKN